MPAITQRARMVPVCLTLLTAVAMGLLTIPTARAAEPIPKDLTEMHGVLAQLDDCRALAMRGLIRAQELKTVYLYGRGFGLKMSPAVPEDMLVEGLWLFDYLDAMDLTGVSLVGYAAAEKHPHLAQELATMRAFVPVAAGKALAYYDKAAGALAAARRKVNAAAGAKSPFTIVKLLPDPVAKGPNEGIAGDGFRLGWSWCVAPPADSELGRHYTQHGYTPDRLFERAEAFGLDYIAPTDGDIFAWRVVETAPGKFDWTRADEVLARFKKHGLAIWLPLPVNQSTPPKWLGEELNTRVTLVNDKGEVHYGPGRGGGSFNTIRSPEPRTTPPNMFNPKVQGAFARYAKALIAHIRAAGVPIVAVDLGGETLVYGGRKYAGPEAAARKAAWVAKNKPLPELAEDLWRQHDYVEYFRPAVAAVRAAAADLPIVTASSWYGERNSSRTDRDNELIVRELGTVPYGGSTQSIWDDLRRTLSDTHFGAANTHSGGGNAFAQYAGSGFVHGSLSLHTWPVPMLRGFFWADHLIYPDFRPSWSALFDWRRLHERAQGMGPEMRYTVPQPQTAILWSATSDLYQFPEKEFVGGTYGFGIGPANYHRIGAIGWDRLLNMIGLSHDFVTERQAAAGALGKYELLILPAAQALPEATVKAIRAFVRAGGKVIATSAPALAGADLKPKGAGQLADVFGAAFEAFTGQTPVAGTSLKSPTVHEVMYGSVHFNKESDLKKTLYCTFRPSGGTTVVDRFTSGEPAVLLNRFGQGAAAVLGYPIGREFFQGDTYHMHYGHNWQDLPNGTVFQQALCLYVEGLLKKMSFQREAVVAGEWAPRSADRAEGWPAWKWTRKGGGYRDYPWKRSSLEGHTAARRYTDDEPRSVEIAFRGRKGNPNRYMTLFSREGAYGFAPGVVHFAAISKELKIELFRTDVRSVYDLSAGCAVPTKIEKGRTTLETMIEPSMPRMLVIAAGKDDQIRLYAGKRQRGGADAGLRTSVQRVAAAAAAPPERIVFGAKDIAAFLKDRGPKGLTISAESPLWLPAAKKLAQAVKAKYGQPVRITRNSPRVHGAFRYLDTWRDEKHGFLERPDVVLGNRGDSHYVCALLTSPVVQPPDLGAGTFTAPLPIVATQSFPGPGRCAVTLTRPYRKQNADKGPIYRDTPAKARWLVVGGSDAAGVEAGVAEVIKLLK